MPFLENVTRGRGIPRERLAEVGQHYFGFGGRSPINDQCRSLLAALRAELDRRGIDRPLYWGNRNWDPTWTTTLAEIEADGHRRVRGDHHQRVPLVLLVSAVPGEPVRRRAGHAGAGGQDPALRPPSRGSSPPRSTPRWPPSTSWRGGPGPPGWSSSPTPSRPRWPTSSGPPPRSAEGGYVDWHRAVAAEVTRQVAAAAGRDHWDLVYCSRSGPPSQPWTEPDVNDHLRGAAGGGVSAASC